MCRPAHRSMMCLVRGSHAAAAWPLRTLRCMQAPFSRPTCTQGVGLGHAHSVSASASFESRGDQPLSAPPHTHGHLVPVTIVFVAAHSTLACHAYQASTYWSLQTLKLSGSACHTVIHTLT